MNIIGNKKQKISTILNTLLIYINKLGSYHFYIIIALLFLVAKEYLIVQILTIGIIVLYVFIIPLRLLFFHKRPIPIKYHNIIQKIDASSFPSGHTARTVYLFLVFLYFVKQQYLWITWVFISIGIVYSRVYFKKHYIQDVVIGTLVALISFILIMFLMNYLLLFFN